MNFQLRILNHAYKLHTFTWCEYFNYLACPFEKVGVVWTKSRLKSCSYCSLYFSQWEYFPAIIEKLCSVSFWSSGALDFSFLNCSQTERNICEVHCFLDSTYERRIFYPLTWFHLPFRSVPFLVTYTLLKPPHIIKIIMLNLVLTVQRELYNKTI